jgi:NADPH2:quinone reductase
VQRAIGIASAASADFARARGADVALDYRSPSVAPDLAAQLAFRGAGGGPDDAGQRRSGLRVLDTVTSSASVAMLAATLAGAAAGGGGRGALYAHTARLSAEQAEMLKSWSGGEGADATQRIWVGSVHDDTPPGGRLFGEVVTVMLERFMAEGKVKGMPFEVVPGGLAGVLDALVKLRDRKTGNSKFVVRIGDTPGLQSEEK